MIRWVYYYEADADCFNTDRFEDPTGFHEEVHSDLIGMFRARSVEIESIEKVEVDDAGTVKVELIGLSSALPKPYDNFATYYWLNPDADDPTEDDVRCKANPFVHGFLAE